MFTLRLPTEGEVFDVCGSGSPRNSEIHLLYSFSIYKKINKQKNNSEFFSPSVYILMNGDSC